MRTQFLLLASIVSLAGCEPASQPAAQVEQQANPGVTSSAGQPIAEKRPHEMNLHGHTRVDEYFWLRDDTRQSPEVLAYLEAENAYFEETMKPWAGLQETLFKEMTSRLDPDESSVPYLKNGYWYYSRFEPGSEYAIYARRKGSMEADEEVLLDGNQRVKGDGFYALSGIEVSDDHRFAAIAEDWAGRRINEIRILDTQSGEFLPEVIGNASGSLAWSGDGQYLFYLNKHPETLLAYQLMRHRLGTDPSEDALVYEESDNTFYTDLGRSRSGEFLVLFHQKTDTTEVQLLAADDPLGVFKPFLPRETGHEYDVDHAAGRFFIRTNWNAENFRVMTVGLAASTDKSRWQEVIPQRADAMVRNLQAFDKWLVVGERKDGLRKVRVLAHDGSVDRYLDASEEASVMWPDRNVSTDTDVIRYGFSSLVTPDQVWEIDLHSVRPGC